MSDPTITCPHCKTEIKLTESLAAPLIDSTRKQYEQRIADKDADVARREESIREQQTALAHAERPSTRRLRRSSRPKGRSLRPTRQRRLAFS